MPDENNSFIGVTFASGGSVRVLSHDSPSAITSVRLFESRNQASVVIDHGMASGDMLTLHLTVAQAKILVTKLQEITSDHG